MHRKTPLPRGLEAPRLRHHRDGVTGASVSRTVLAHDRQVGRAVALREAGSSPNDFLKPLQVRQWTERQYEPSLHSSSHPRY